MDDVKVNLNIVLLGSTMLSKQECLKNPKESYEHEKIRVETVKKDPKKKNKFIKSVEWLDIKVRKCRTASQSINMTKQAYEYMISKECPYFSKPKDWARMSKIKRLEAHLEETCKALGGISYTYQVFED
jgi:hypothetical protein